MQQEYYANYIKRKFKFVDMIFGTHSLHKFPEILWKAREERVIDVVDVDGYIAEDIPVLRQDDIKAYVSVMYGCDNFCTYCIVPYVRGRQRSRESSRIIDEIKELAKNGYKEITLLGQNVNSYGLDLDEDINFAKLLSMVNEIDGIERIRFATSHPKDISDELIDVIATCDKVCKQLHLPFQAGNDKVLKEMNRKYTREKYLSIIKKLKEKIPNIALSSDVIVGFPGETNEEFEDTLSLVKEVRFDSLFTFIFSKRRGTKAEKMPDVLTDEEKKINFEKLLETQTKISKEINDSYVGKVFDILVEGVSKTDESMLTGRTDSNKVVNFSGDSTLKGQIVKVKIVKAMTWSLYGERV